MKKKLYIIAGFISVALGVAGIFLPLLPTTAFLLLAAWLFSKGSPKYRQWLLNHKYLGPHIKNYTEKRGITRKAKLRTIATLWITLTISAVLFWSIWYIPLILLVVGIGVSWHVLSLKTVRNDEKHNQD